tara:strand:+ start:222 stop:365 length:144 start_codon:yes stop_codon:yes gene_type:complete
MKYKIPLFINLALFPMLAVMIGCRVGDSNSNFPTPIPGFYDPIEVNK